MEYLIKFIHLDNTKTEVALEEVKIKDFFTKLNCGEIYWHDPDKNEGFWLNLDKIRYINFTKIEKTEEIPEKE